MGGGSSKVLSSEEENELTRRISGASMDRHQLSLLSLNSGKVLTHAEAICNINKTLSKSADKLVDKKAPYTSKVTVTKKSLVSKKNDIEALKQAERDLKECESAMEPMRVQLSALVTAFEKGLHEMEKTYEIQKKHGKNAVSQNLPAQIEAPAPPKVGGFVEDSDQATNQVVAVVKGSKKDDDLKMEDHDELFDSMNLSGGAERPKS